MVVAACSVGLVVLRFQNFAHNYKVGQHMPVKEYRSEIRGPAATLEDPIREELGTVRNVKTSVRPLQARYNSWIISRPRRGGAKKKNSLDQDGTLDGQHNFNWHHGDWILFRHEVRVCGGGAVGWEEKEWAEGGS